MASRWPKDNQAALIKFYGDPGKGEVAKRLVKIVPPFKITYDGNPVKTITFHKLAAPSLEAALLKIWNYYECDQAEIDRLGISKYAGTYNHRKVRGSSTKWSNHAFATAYDMNAEDNGFGTGKGNIPLPVVAAFKSEGFAWGGDYEGRTDPMHFELCDRGEPDRTFEEWLKHYKVKPKTATAAPKPVVVPTKKPKPVAPEEDVQGDPDLWHVQRRLRVMMYNPGGLDGVWGGMTAGAIIGFLNDRGSKIKPPTSADQFVKVLNALRDELTKAEKEQFTRPIAPERAMATPLQLAEKLPEVKASITAERAGFWASIATGASALVTGVAKSAGEAIEMLNPVKEFVADLPWPVWVGGALVVAIALYLISRKSGEAGDEATKAYQEGSRV